jgi:hypothetical protein
MWIRKGSDPAWSNLVQKIQQTGFTRCDPFLSESVLYFNDQSVVQAESKLRRYLSK